MAITAAFGCLSCGFRADDSSGLDVWTERAGFLVRRWAWCPKCGAQMRGPEVADLRYRDAGPP